MIKHCSISSQYRFVKKYKYNESICFKAFKLKTMLKSPLLTMRQIMRTLSFLWDISYNGKQHTANNTERAW